MHINEIIDEIEMLKDKAKNSNIKGYDFELMKRIVLRLDSFSECSECKAYTEEFVAIIKEINDNSLVSLRKKYKSFQQKVLGHLQKKHKLVSNGYYLSILMSSGTSIGLLIGLIFSQQIGQPAFMGMGLTMGIAIGVAIGTSLDTKAKNAGLTI